jgi:hypothetical protein
MIHPTIAGGIYNLWNSDTSLQNSTGLLVKKGIRPWRLSANALSASLLFFQHLL